MVRPRQTAAPASVEVRISDLIAALSYALDLTEGQPMGHSVGTCVLGMRLASQLKLSGREREDLYYALLLKDAGCSSNASRMCQIFGADERQAKLDVKTTDWTKVSLETLVYLMHNAAPGRSWGKRLRHVVSIAAGRHRNSRELISMRCERGANVARKIGFNEATAHAIHCLDEHWDGSGYPGHLKGNQIPLLAQIAGLCQTLEVYARTEGRYAAFEVMESRSGSWFNPELVRAAQELERDVHLWRDLLSRNVAMDLVRDLDPGSSLIADESRIDSICEAFGTVIDAKSPFTQRHSQGVAEMAVRIADTLGLAQEQKILCRRAALLHDLGKLGVPNTILDKPGTLNAAEWEVIRMHPLNTLRILDKIPCFSELAFVASSHHERLDGSGYPLGLRGEGLPVTARLVAVADVFDALSAKRPYRDALPVNEAIELMAREVPRRLDAACFDAMCAVV